MIVKNDFPKIAAQLPAKARALDVATARRIAQEARALVPVLTGALKASISSIGPVARANIRYAGYVNFGTSKMAAEAYWTPAVEKAQREQEAELTGLVKV